jgi:hypothetical protein
MKIEIEIPKGCKAEWVDGVLALAKNKKEDLRPVTERVKTFEDAVAELGEAHPLCIHFREMYDNFLFEGGDAVSDIVAYLKLRIIIAALNEGWMPQFIGNENRYYPWFELYNEEDWNDLPLSEDTKRERGVLLDGSVYNGAYGCFVGVGAYCIHSYTGSRLCFKTRELALYAGKQFASLWLDFRYRPDTECKPIE